MMEQGDKEIKSGKALEAHSSIEVYRYVLWQIRAEAGIETLINKLNDLHEIMESLEHSIIMLDEGIQLKKLMNSEGIWFIIKWLEVKYLIDSNDYPKELKEAALHGVKAIDGLKTAADSGDIDMSDEKIHDAKKAFRVIFFSDSVY